MYLSLLYLIEYNKIWKPCLKINYIKVWKYNEVINDEEKKYIDIKNISHKMFLSTLHLWSKHFLFLWGNLTNFKLYNFSLILLNWYYVVIKNNLTSVNLLHTLVVPAQIIRT
jgi:hypothetical protein